ncbi:MAG: helix-turn-helix domain-containing protein [Acholeplasmataceae bacterium]|nr:helix-turn-helix domain-containing protein [Acholeplasmataceae bacterium]
MLNKKELTDKLSDNLIYYRKKAGLTQVQLAEKLNYSDKAISKWERGGSFPDFYVLYELCQLYKIELNDLISNKVDLEKPRKHISRRLITILSTSSVWLLATIIYGVLLIFFQNPPFSWFAFIYAVPISFIVFLILSLIWERKWIPFTALSGVIISIPISIFLSLHLMLDIKNAWFTLIIIIPAEVIAFIAFILKHNISIYKKKNKPLN